MGGSKSASFTRLWHELFPLLHEPLMLSASFLPLYFSFSPCPIVPLMWHDGGFLDSHSTQQRTALALAAKTPYLRLAACRQDAAARRCRGRRLQDETGHGLTVELLSYRKGSSNIRVLKLKNNRRITSDKWENGMTEGTAAAQGDPIRPLPMWSLQGCFFLTTRLHLFPHSATRSMIWYLTLCLLDLLDQAVLQLFVFSAARLTDGNF